MGSFSRMPVAATGIVLLFHVDPAGACGTETPWNVYSTRRNAEAVPFPAAEGAESNGSAIPNRDRRRSTSASVTVDRTRPDDRWLAPCPGVSPARSRIGGGLPFLHAVEVGLGFRSGFPRAALRQTCSRVRFTCAYSSSPVLGEPQAGPVAGARGSESPRTHAKPPPRGIEPLLPDTQVVKSQALTSSNQSVLPVCLPDSAQNVPDLAAVVKAWPKLPEPVRAGIVAMVRTVSDGPTA